MAITASPLATLSEKLMAPYTKAPPPAEAGTGDEESQAPGHSSTHMSLLEATVSPFARSRVS